MSGRLVLLAASLFLAGAGVDGAPARPTASAPKAKPEVQPAVGGQRIFSCRLPGDKLVTVHADGERLVYRYGTARLAELTIVGTPAKRNLFQHIGVHGGDWAVQLSFVNGDHSYIVHSFPRNEIVDNVALSGLVVVRAGKTILDRKCSPWAEISTSRIEDLEAIPQIPEGAATAWGPREAD